MAMAWASVFKLFSRSACVSICIAALTAALVYILLDNMSFGKLDVACKAMSEWVTVPSDQTVRIPLTLSARSSVPIRVARVLTSCGCMAVEEDEKVKLKLPLRITPEKPKQYWLTVSTQGRIGEFTTLATSDYQLLLWRRQQSCHLRFCAVPQWFVVPDKLELIIEEHQDAPQGDLWVFVPRDANPPPKISLDEGPNFISTRVETIPPDERSGYQVATPSWVADSGLRLAYRIKVTVRPTQGADKGSVIKELKLHTTPARSKPVWIRWSRLGP